MISAHELSDLLLDLYRASKESPTCDFQQHALTQVSQHIPFDTAWWAMATQMDTGRSYVHDSFIVGMPEDCASLMNATVQDNVIAQTCSFSPGICFYFSPEQIFGNWQTGMLAEHMGIAHVLCIACRSDIPQLSSFLSFARRERGVPFSDAERRLTECLMPHLANMLQTSMVMQFASIRARDSESRSAMAVVDAIGMLHAAEPGFERLIRLEWSEWEGPFLPAPLLAAIAANRAIHLGKAVKASFDLVRESRLVTLAKRSPGDLLSPRERTVAEGFAKGETYKELAKRLGLSPATVRHHIRAIYEKLEVADKAALATLLTSNQGHSSVLPGGR